MKPTLTLAGLLLAGLSVPLLAQTATGTTAGRDIDANHDGFIDRTEAAAVPRLAEHFDRLDADHDGRLAKDERPRHGQHRGRHGEHHRGMERMDTDGDGRISRSEFDAGQAKWTARAQVHADADADRPARQPPQFSAIDANRDGYLVGSELRAYHERMRPQREAERTARFNERFTQADVNRDGKLGRTEVASSMPQLERRFAWLDENRDGFISRAELEADRGRH